MWKISKVDHDKNKDKMVNRSVILSRNPVKAGLEIKKNVWSQFANSYENLVATLKILVAKLIKAIQLRSK